MTPVLVMVLAVVEVRQTGLAAALGRATPGRTAPTPAAPSVSATLLRESNDLDSPLVTTGVPSGTRVFGCIASA